MSDHIQKNKQKLNQILAKNTGRSIEEIVEATERDHFMNADEAASFGLIDKILNK